jgi:cellulose synthase operon protein YhjQ
MNERNVPPDPNGTPEDVAALYSWANLHGAKYRDFSASRAQSRERARQLSELTPVKERPAANANQAASEGPVEEHRPVQNLRPPENQRLLENLRPVERPRPMESERLIGKPLAEGQRPVRAARTDEDARRAALVAEQQAAQMAAQQAQAAQLAAQLAARQAEAAEQAAQQAARGQTRLDPFPTPLGGAASVRSEPQAREAEPSSAPDFATPAPAAQAPSAASAAPPAYRQEPPAAKAPLREEIYGLPRAPWIPPDARESAARPAWLTPEITETAGHAAVPPAPEGTLQGSRDRITARWYALRSLFEDNVPSTQAPAPAAARAPVLAVFSLAGGVGKTSVVATLGRVLSARSERVLLVDTAAYGLLPFFFGARDQRPGLLRTFSPPPSSGDAPLQMITLDPDTLAPEAAAPDAMNGEITKYLRGVSRVIIDLATASGAITRRVMRLAPQVLVPLMPDMSSVVSVSSIDAFFDHNNGLAPHRPHYVLNQFDPSLPLHLDIREVLREQLGDRLLPFVLRRSPAVSEALAEGMTVLDYAPNSAVAEDFASLAGWVKSISAPASMTFRGVRWSER